MLKNVHRISALLLALAPFFTYSDNKVTHHVTIYSQINPTQIGPELYQPGVRSTHHYFDDSAVPGFALVHQKRNVIVQAPQSIVQTSDIAALIDPTTAHVSSLSNPEGTRILEQSFHYDLLNQATLLNKYLYETFTVNNVTGQLIGYSNDKVYLKDGDNRIHHLDHPSLYPERPQGLYTKPTLRWSIQTNTSGTNTLDISYRTGGMTWWADYNAIYDEQNKQLALNAWVNIVNRCGTEFLASQLELIAGDVQTVTPEPQAYRVKTLGHDMAAMATESGPQFTQDQLFEYYSYRLNRMIDLPNQTTKQLEFFPTIHKIPVEHVLIYNGSGVQHVGHIYSPRLYNHGQSNITSVDAFLKFDNKKANQLGFALPAGRVRINQQSAEGNLAFIGEDTISHTPKDETLKLRLGSAFDVKGSRTQSNFKKDEKAQWLEETFEITLKNHKNETVEVLVIEPLNRWKTWRITQSSMPYEKLNSQMIQFTVSVPANGETKVSYSTRYTW